MSDSAHDALVSVATVAAAVVGALAAIQVIHWVLLRLSRRSELLAEFAARAHRPAQFLAALIALQITLRAVTTTGAWRPAVVHALWLGIIAATAWLVAALVLVVEDLARSRFRTDVEDNLHARKVRTQMIVVRRVTVAVIAVVAIGAMLVTFPAARAAGASLLASAGIAGVIAGLAAQSVLSNAFAGIQIAFSDSLRLDDVVVVEGEWGRIEEITLSYVVVHVWDDRRLVLPTSYFTTTPFENWTRTQAAVLGTVELDVDWSVPMEPLRGALDRVLAGTELWDERVGVLQVTDAVGAMVRVRALVSATDAPTLWDLRCLVREELVSWLQRHYPSALPRIRADISSDRSDQELAAGPDRSTSPATSSGAAPRAEAADADAGAVSEGGPGHSGEDARVFGGSADGRERGSAFTGPA